MTTGKTTAKSKPVFRLPPTASAIEPTIVGHIVAPKSPASAKKANIAVPPLGQVFEEIQIVPGHIMPTASPQRAQPIRPKIAIDDSAANK